MEKNIVKEFYEYVSTQKNKTKIGQKIYNWLDSDNLSSIIVNGKYYYTEKTCTYSDFPNYAFDYIDRFMKKKGYSRLGYN